MYYKLKKKIACFILIALLIALSSCGSNDYSIDSAPHADGVAFEFYKSYDEGIDIHLPVDISNSLACEYVIGNEESSNALWTINYDFNNDYLTNYPNALFEIVNSIKGHLDNQISFGFELYKDDEIVQMEYTLDNPNKEEIGYVIASIYLPILIFDNGNSFTASIPIKSIALLKTDTYIKSINDSNIIWEDFITNPNLILK